MLSRLSACAALAVLAAIGGAQTATAAPPVTCPEGTPVCFVEVEKPGEPAKPATGGGGASGGGQERLCITWNGDEVPCYSEHWGWLNPEDGHYWKLLDPQPPDDVVWEGHYPEGAIYHVMSPVTYQGSEGGWAWRATPPPGYGGLDVTPAQLAARAVDEMALTGPAIGLSVPADRFGIVGVPVWLWTDVGPTTWGPNSATASVPGLSVTATAQARQIVWDTGDGRTETCRNPGTAYDSGQVTSPTCQHVYERSSAGQPDDAYEIAATTTWDVSWTGGGTSGSLTVTRRSSATVRIGEVQVLVTHR